MKVEISHLEQHPTLKHNLTRQERLTLRELTLNNDLIINKADKGSTIVVRDRNDYIEEGISHLSDENTYSPLDRDHTSDVTKFVKNTLQSLRKVGLLSPKMADFCMPPPNVRTAVIYFLKKIHKNPMGIRPIVSTVNSATANLAEFLDIYLQPIMKQLPAYLKDTTQFVNEISEIPVEQNTWLVTVDVKSLYTNIPNEEGIQACHEAWRIRETTDPQHPPADVLRHLLEIVLKLNTFEFDNKHYLQKFGTAMGSKLAPAYANTFMGKLEKTILASSPLKPVYYRRFIDDIFMLWPHSEEELIRFIQHMNRANRSIQFTYEKSQSEAVFLDVVTYKVKDHNTTDDTYTLNVRTHIKPTNKQLYVREDSYHPPGTTKGVTIGEAIRYLRTNSEPKKFSKMILHHKRNLAKRGYPRARTSSQLKQIKFSTRAHTALKDTTTKNKHTDTPIEQQKPTFVTRYCPNARRAFRIVHRHWTSVHTDVPLLKRFFRTTPRLAYKSNPNLARKLVRAKLRRHTDEPTTATTTDPSAHLQTTQQTQRSSEIVQLANLKHPPVTHRNNITHCPDSRCPLHPKLIHSRMVRSKISRRTFQTHGAGDCNTPRVIYLIQCKHCGRQYVGQTAQPFKSRIAKHLTAIRNRHQPGVLHEHFRRGDCAGTNNVSVQLLDTIIPANGDTAEHTEQQLKRLESLWMERLKSEYPQGLNWAKYDPRKRSVNNRTA